MTTPDGWLSVDEVAAYFAVARRTVNRKVSSGEWPCSYLPGIAARRFSPDDVARIEADARAASGRRSA